MTGDREDLHATVEGLESQITRVATVPGAYLGAPQGGRGVQGVRGEQGTRLFGAAPPGPPEPDEDDAQAGAELLAERVEGTCDAFVESLTRHMLEPLSAQYGMSDVVPLVTRGPASDAPRTPYRVNLPRVTSMTVEGVSVDYPATARALLYVPDGLGGADVYAQHVETGTRRPPARPGAVVRGVHAIGRGVRADARTTAAVVAWLFAVLVTRPVAAYREWAACTEQLELEQGLRERADAEILAIATAERLAQLRAEERS